MDQYTKVIIIDNTCILDYREHSSVACISLAELLNSLEVLDDA